MIRRRKKKMLSNIESTGRKVTPMPKASVFSLALSRDLADRIVDRVITSEFSNTDVSALFPDQDTTRDLALVKSSGTQWREEPPASQSAAWWTARRSGFASIGALAAGAQPVSRKER